MAKGKSKAVKQAEEATTLGTLRRDFLRLLEDFAGHGRQRIAEAFRAWVRFACVPVMEATCRFADDHEGVARYAKEYAETVEARKSYCPDPVKTGGGMLGILMEALTIERGDFLGCVMEDIAATNPGTGQFFTPKHLSRLMARVVTGDIQRDEEGLVTVHEPTCGAGVLLLECCAELMERGVAQRDIWVDAGDIDMGAFCCTYLQLSLLGYPGVVRLGDALTLQYRETAYTLAGFLHGTVWRVRRARRRRHELMNPVSVDDMRALKLAETAGKMKDVMERVEAAAPESAPAPAVPSPTPPAAPEETISKKPVQGLLFELD